MLKHRLLHTIKPLEYDILLKPDLQHFTFLGEETLTFNVVTPTKEIALHAKNLVVTKAVLLEKNVEHEAEIAYNKKDMSVVLSFAHVIGEGQHTLQLTFHGVISDQLKGWYKSAYSVDGKTRHMATTQFEEIGAREVFPSIDDPMAKAIFHISLTIPNHLTAISNTIDSHVAEHENGYKTIRFAPTPKMATYALAFIVGEFEYVEKKTTTGTLVRVFVTPGKKSQAAFALDTAVKMLPFYEKYFDIPYPLPVLDLIAIPDFDAGAMENWGAITAREAALLVDEQQTSAANKQWVATVIAHELTHMWFGNLVTMQWWDDLWLNEGFASYMEYVGVDALFPEWHVWEQFGVLDHNRAMGLDSLETTHPIQAKITNVEKISEMFDEVSYSKGASVIQMLAEYLGEEDFREGLRYYLKKHAYSNAKTDDLWQALEKVSGKKIAKIMNSFTQKPGLPLLTAERGENAVKLSQTRFFISSLSRKKTKDTTTWVIPLTNKTGEKEEKMFFDAKETSLPLPSSFLKINVGETSFVRTIYDKTLYGLLGTPIREKLLSSLDRMGILRDAFDSAESGYSSADLALELVKFYKNETSYIVWASLSGKLGKIENLIDDEKVLEKFYEYCRELYLPIADIIRWEKKTTDSHEDILLRNVILSSLGTYKDTKTIQKAQALFEKIVQDKKNVETDIRGVVYAITAENGGKKEFELLQNMYIKEDLAAEKNRIGNALCLFEDPRLVQKALEFSLSEHVRTQDIGRFLVIAFSNRKAREVTWEFIKKHWNILMEKMEGLSMGWIIEGAASVTSETLLADMKQFFKTHQHPKLEKTMKQVVEQIESTIDWKSRDGQKIEKFLLHKV